MRPQIQQLLMDLPGNKVCISVIVLSMGAQLNSCQTISPEYRNRLEVISSNSSSRYLLAFQDLYLPRGCHHRRGRWTRLLALTLPTGTTIRGI